MKSYTSYYQGSQILYIVAGVCIYTTQKLDTWQCRQNGSASSITVYKTWRFMGFADLNYKSHNHPHDSSEQGPGR